jgi:hypothetical protein
MVVLIPSFMLLRKIATAPASVHLSSPIASNTSAKVS